jgi:hypothetical protein
MLIFGILDLFSTKLNVEYKFLSLVYLKGRGKEREEGKREREKKKCLSNGALIG